MFLLFSRLRNAIIGYDGDINKAVILEDGCNLNYLHICVSIDSQNRDAALKFLLTRKDLKINQPSGPSNNCWTALHIVAYAGFADTLDLLLRHGGDPYLSDATDSNVWDVASARGNYSCIEVLEIFANSLIPTCKLLFNDIFKSLCITTKKKNVTNNDVFSIDSLAKVESDESDSNTSEETIIYIPRIPEKNCETKIYVDSNARLTFVERKQSIDLNDNKNIDVNVDELSCSMIEARREKLGLSPVPVTPTTRAVYAKQLAAFEMNPMSPSPIKRKSKYSEELESFIEEQDEVKIKRLETEFRDYFNKSKTSKDCFTYILLDPRVTKNLQSYTTTGVEYNKKLFRRFLRSIFYIGKGKKRRPMEHFLEARNQQLLNKKSEKLDRIIDIWSSGRGVVSLHCFQNISSDEALSREFCMLAAIKNENLTNIKTGDTSKLKGLKWNDHKKNFFGASLLQKAYFYLLIEGEREIKPADIKK
ncbi:hypothetical protein B4U80_09196 [Leptotrombidium deliense]|uniref:Uncharacterized protein n=1 Tax=Leptotrombidium deliense TaxID=299467 RepID=A0A443SHA4_9ACAR|nr:hypothetical protein B4U80_09196 [Leptotrombidium deliense]